MPKWKASPDLTRRVEGYEDQLYMNHFFSSPYSFDVLTRCRVDSKSKKEEQATGPRTYVNIEMADIPLLAQII